MPVPTPEQLGPLAGLVGTWEGDHGIDVSFHHSKGEIGETPYRERNTFSPFGPVDNGTQSLFGLDYRGAAWRIGEDEPFHTEVGYWLWDVATGQVMKCFMVPRGSTLIAGGDATADSRSFSLKATVGDETYGVLSNKYLAAAARTVLFTMDVTIGDGEYSYDETTVYDLARTGTRIEHTDHNTLRRID
jgi:hypothetical protein